MAEVELGIKTKTELNKMNKNDLVQYASSLGDTFLTLKDKLLNPETGLVPTLQRQVEMFQSQLQVSQKINQELIKQLGFVERTSIENAQYARRESLELHGIPESFGNGETLETNIIKLINDMYAGEDAETEATNEAGSEPTTPPEAAPATDGTYAAAVKSVPKLTRNDFHVIHRLHKKDRVIMKFRRIAHAVLAKKNELKKNDLKKKHRIRNAVYLNESMCHQIKHLFFLCRKLKLAGKIAYYSFFNGALKIKRTEDGQKKNIAHISDISRVTNLSKADIEKIAGIEQSAD